MCPEITGQVQCRTTVPELVNASLNALAGNWFLLFAPRSGVTEAVTDSVESEDVVVNL